MQHRYRVHNQSGNLGYSCTYYGNTAGLVTELHHYCCIYSSFNYPVLRPATGV